MNRAQQIVAETYCNGELNCPDVMDTLESCGDGLFRFLMNELSDAEDCVDLETAMNRIDTITTDLLTIARALFTKY
jgi:hypothetical protein